LLKKLKRKFRTFNIGYLIFKEQKIFEPVPGSFAKAKLNAGINSHRNFYFTSFSKIGTH